MDKRPSTGSPSPATVKSAAESCVSITQPNPFSGADTNADIDTDTGTDAYGNTGGK